MDILHNMQIFKSIVNKSKFISGDLSCGGFDTSQEKVHSSSESTIIYDHKIPPENSKTDGGQVQSKYNFVLLLHSTHIVNYLQ